ncbi:PREDICTED: reticulon-like protein B8 [Lupinus angustifolius]|uniref:reticulon-like protein B8 n=1 Tax=Lupinus angustifolius TaxID=3871 RepID=UPI00092F17BD|nr:PREDICTED: reticulon-like protein B8 [Lupinus angustifolius]
MNYKLNHNHFFYLRFSVPTTFLASSYFSLSSGTMSDKITPENLFNNIVETLADKHKSVSFFEEEKSSSVATQFNRLFGRQKPVHHILGGGKSADCLLWRNKKISASVLTAATIVWVLFEWLNYNFLSLLCFALVLGMFVQFLWTNASGLLNRNPSKAPRFVIPEDFFVNIATMVGTEVNRGLRFLQDIACGGNLKQFLIAVVSLLAGAVIGSWCNFLTVMYIGNCMKSDLPIFVMGCKTRFFGARNENDDDDDDDTGIAVAPAA